MKQRGRKSGQALETGRLTDLALVRAEKRAEAPSEFTELQASVWRAVVNSKPADWFTPDTLPLLVAYCKHVSVAAVLDQQIDAFKPEWLAKDGGLERYRMFLDAREKQTRAITATARSMRLTQQSQYNKETAYRQKGQGAESDPWEWKPGDDEPG